MDYSTINKIDNNSAQGTQNGSTITDLNIAQINLQHCKKATYTYCRDLTMKHTDITMIQEPWVRGSKIHAFGSYTTVCSTIEQGGNPERPFMCHLPEMR